MPVDVYMTGDVSFQVDCPDGSSFEFRPSRFEAGGVELLEWSPQSALDNAQDAFRAGVLAAVFGRA